MTVPHSLPGRDPDTTTSADAGQPLADVITATGTTVVAVTGGPCQLGRLAQLLDAVATEDGPGTLQIVDVAEQAATVREMNLQVVPTFLVYVDAQLVVRRTGAVGRRNLEAMLGR